MIHHAEIIRVNDLRKSYGDLKAVDGVSFSVSAGEVFDQRGAILWSLRSGHRFLVEDRQRFTMGPLQQATQGRSTVLGVQGKVEKVC